MRICYTSKVSTLCNFNDINLHVIPALQNLPCNMCQQQWTDQSVDLTQYMHLGTIIHNIHNTQYTPYTIYTIHRPICWSDSANRHRLCSSFPRITLKHSDATILCYTRLQCSATFGYNTQHSLHFCALNLYNTVYKTNRPHFHTFIH